MSRQLAELERKLESGARSVEDLRCWVVWRRRISDEFRGERLDWLHELCQRCPGELDWLKLLEANWIADGRDFLGRETIEDYFPHFLRHTSEPSPNLSEMGPLAVPGLIRGTLTDSFLYRSGCLIALRRLGRPGLAAVPRLLELLSDEEPYITSIAAEGLCHMLQTPEEWRKAIRDFEASQHRLGVKVTRKTYTGLLKNCFRYDGFDQPAIDALSMVKPREEIGHWLAEQLEQHVSRYQLWSRQANWRWPRRGDVTNFILRMTELAPNDPAVARVVVRFLSQSDQKTRDYMMAHMPQSAQTSEFILQNLLRPMSQGQFQIADLFHYRWTQVRGARQVLPQLLSQLDEHIHRGEQKNAKILLGMLQKIVEKLVLELKIAEKLQRSRSKLNYQAKKVLVWLKEHKKQLKSDYLADFIKISAYFEQEMAPWHDEIVRAGLRNHKKCARIASLSVLAHSKSSAEPFHSDINRLYFSCAQPRQLIRRVFDRIR